MGKKLRVQRRGRGGHQYKASKMNKKAPSKYPTITAEGQQGFVKSMEHEPGRGAPLAYIEFSPGKGYHVSATEGISLNQPIMVGVGAIPKVGNVLHLKDIPVGTMVSNIELRPGDGGKIARSSGAFGTVIAHIDNYTTVRLPSRRIIRVTSNSSGVKMPAAMHPHGGGRHRRPGKSTTVSRHAPPGAKVGLIAARNSGKRQRKRI